MASLWLISGIAIRFIMAKVSVTRFVSQRSYRLLLPLIFGVLVIVPPQLYFEMTFKGDLDVSYWEFYKAFFDLSHPMFEKYNYGILPHMDVNHLWYLRALWKYSLYLLPLLPLLNSSIFSKLTEQFFKLNGIVQIVAGAIPVVVIQLMVDQSEVRYPLGFLFLVYGYLIGWNIDFWNKVKDKRRVLFACFVINYLVFVTFYSLVFMGDDAAVKSDAALKDGVLNLVGFTSYALQRMLGLLVVLGYAHQYLNKKTKYLEYFSDAVYPFYIVHQTIIIVAGSLLSQLSLGPIIEPLLLFSVTISGCFLSYELIRRTAILRPFFGLKQVKRYPSLLVKSGFLLAALAVVPTAYQILS
jgi:hypothetical protein